MSTETSRLLVLGPDEANKLAVISKLSELCGDSTTAAATSDVTVLNLQTKYYRAPVEVHVHQVIDNAPEPALKHELHDYEALLCVVDATQRESFLHVHRFAKRIVDTLPYDVCLLVAGTSSNPSENVKKMESWCQENGFEFVDLDAQGPSGEDSVIDEKQGIERVLEALHCNMWRSMEMNPPKVETPEETEPETKEDKVDSVETEEQNTPTDDSKLQALLQALEIAGDGGEADKDDDLDMAQFSALISEVRNVRDQGESLTDEQRRERAAEVAMKLWNFLGADEEDESD